MPLSRVTIFCSNKAGAIAAYLLRSTPAATTRTQFRTPFLQLQFHYNLTVELQMSTDISAIYANAEF